MCVLAHIHTYNATTPHPPGLRSLKFNVKRATMLCPTNPATKQPMHSRHTFPIADSWPLPTIPCPPPLPPCVDICHLTRKGNSHSSLAERRVFKKVCHAGNNAYSPIKLVFSFVEQDVGENEKCYFCYSHFWQVLGGYTGLCLRTRIY